MSLESTGHIGIDHEGNGAVPFLGSELLGDSDEPAEDHDEESYVHFMGALWDYAEVFRDWGLVGDYRDGLVESQPMNAIAA